jgi:hypothetical protein
MIGEGDRSGKQFEYDLNGRFFMGSLIGSVNPDDTGVLAFSVQRVGLLEKVLGALPQQDNRHLRIFPDTPMIRGVMMRRMGERTRFLVKTQET